jgi:hypothetical protein
MAKVATFACIPFCVQGDIGANGARILQYQRKLKAFLQERHVSKM